MSYEIYQQMRDEELRQREAIAAQEAEVDTVTKLYFEGEFDGKIGNVPQHPESLEYWRGFCGGLRHYWLGQQGKSLATEF